MRTTGIVLVLAALYAQGTDLLNEEYADGTTIDFETWDGPRNLARDPTGGGDDSGNSFGVYEGDRGDLGEGKPVAS